MSYVMTGKLNYDRRQKLEFLRSQLERERSSFEKQWRDLSDYILPRRSRFFVTDANRGDRRNHKIIDTTATLAARTLRSGMMGGVTSPARPWFRLTTPDPELSEFTPVKQWLYDVGERMRTLFIRSNLYNVLPIIYGDMGVFGTAAMYMEPDAQFGLRFYSFPIGSYMIAQDHNLVVNTFYREFEMTVSQIVDKFGRLDPLNPQKINWDNISTMVKGMWESKNTQAWVTVAHCIKPNEMYNPNSSLSKNKKWISIYYERGVAGKQSSSGFLGPSGVDAEKFLSERGYDYFPVLCPRWEITGEDVYGTNCPGMTTIGDVKQLQTGEKRGLQAIEKMVNPPMIAPSAMKQTNASILPGDITYADVREGMQGFRPVYETRFDVNALEMKQQQVRERISKGFYEDLFLMMAQTDRRQITATEIDERREEKLLALGPVLEQLNQDLLDPLIDNTFFEMGEAGMLPEPPEEIAGEDLKVEYISIMAQAQKMIGVSSIDRFTNYVAGIASIAPEILDKVNGDQLIDVYGDMTSIPPGIVRGDDEVANIRAEKAKAMARQAQAEQAKLASDAMKNLSQTPLEEGSALSAAMSGGGIGLV